MNRREFLKTAGMSAAFALGGCMSTAENFAGKAIANKPNIIFIMIDDLGWRDVGFMGSTYYETPNIDKLAAEGMIFDNAYTCGPNCAPTRASLMSGQYTPRHGVLSVNRSNKAPQHLMKLKTAPIRITLATEVVTIVEALKPAGYVSASIGKWHLGNDPELGPQAQGFDINVGGTHNGHPPQGRYFSPYNNPKLPDGPRGEYLTDRLTVEALKFIEANKNKPFFLYLPHYAVHSPIKAKKEIIAKYQKKKPIDAQNNPKYAAMIESVDEGIGRILDKLDELKITNNTMIFFYSDNGGAQTKTSNKPLRGHKGQLYEGGIRVPLTVRWPAVVRPTTTCKVPVTSIDFYPTLVELAAASMPSNQIFDGESIAGLLKGQKSLKRDAIYWHFPCYLSQGPKRRREIRQAPAGAIRKGNWKLMEFFEDSHLELYNLKEDIGEKNNLARTMPDKTKELYEELKAWRRSVGAKIPVELNPAYNPSSENERAK